ncbi:MAG: minor capsid protein, partial [Lactobacillus sp.]|uniref:minor capsid protein n=1 Tax=Lactobacillus sp. TaxID=1591 RepID=UPI0023C5A82B
MGIKVHVDLNIMNHKLSEDQLRHGRLAMANDAQQAMEKYVPKKSGHLRDNAK